MQSASSGLAYSTKGNILFPGAAAEATIVQANAALRLNDVLRGTPGLDNVTGTPTVDSGDLLVRDSGEAAGSQNRRLDQ